MVYEIDGGKKQPITDRMTKTFAAGWTTNEARTNLGTEFIAQGMPADPGVQEFVADLKDLETAIEGFQLESLCICKHMRSSKVVKSKLSYKYYDQQKSVICGTGFDEILEVANWCGYNVHPRPEARVFVAYGTWDPTATPGIYVLERRPTYTRQMTAQQEAAQAFYKEQNAARMKMQQEKGWAKEKR
mmetsp:Transcript_60487/g.129772  ORF Transcript_60487/g.129772 Transcript_60487/m.129772 type:complete len:187 (+) Transcript_60487:96-656(+)